MKVRVNRAFKSYFLSAKNNEKADRLCKKLSSISNTVTPNGTTKGFISPEYFLNLFSNLYIPPWLWKSFKFLMLRLLEDTFLLMPLRKTLPQAEGNYPFPPNKVFWKSTFHPAERGEDYVAEKMEKLNLRGYWLQILINSTIFATSTFLVSVLLCHNLD